MDIYLDEKIEVLERCKTSEAVLEELKDQIRLFNSVVSDDNHSVTEMPYGAAREIAVLVELLDDLAQFTELLRYDSKVPNNLLYLHNYYVIVA